MSKVQEKSKVNVNGKVKLLVVSNINKNENGSEGTVQFKLNGVKRTFTVNRRRYARVWNALNVS